MLQSFRVLCPSAQMNIIFSPPVEDICAVSPLKSSSLIYESRRQSKSFSNEKISSTLPFVVMQLPEKCKAVGVSISACDGLASDISPVHPHVMARTITSNVPRKG